MSIIFATLSYAVLAAWALVSMSAVGMWAWLTISHSVLSGAVDAPSRLDDADVPVGIITSLDLLGDLLPGSHRPVQPVSKGQ